MSTTWTYPNQTVNDLPDQYFIGGVDIILYYDFYDNTGSPINISSAQQLLWKMSPIGGGGSSILSKSGSYVTNGSAGYNRMKITLDASDTLNLTGDTFLSQPIVVDYYGKTSRPSQGKLYITQPIQ